MGRAKTKKTKSQYFLKKKNGQSWLLHKPFPKSQVYIFIGGCVLVFTLSVVAASSSIRATAETVPDSFKSLPQWRLEKVVTEMTEGYPITEMLPYIFTQDQLTTAYLVGIAKKESNWGKRSPKKDGVDCYNYWGFKGEGSRGMALGHGCFGSPEEAVQVVAARIDTLTQEYELETPRQMVVWKCGSSCEGHSEAGVKKWISDVGYYAKEVQQAKN